jgi:hypothetical protein
VKGAVRLTWQGEPQGASHLALGVLLEACSLHLHELLEGVVLWFWPVVHSGTLSRSCAGMHSSGPIPFPRGGISDRVVVYLPVYLPDIVCRTPWLPAGEFPEPGHQEARTRVRLEMTLFTGVRGETV